MRNIFIIFVFFVVLQKANAQHDTTIQFHFHETAIQVKILYPKVKAKGCILLLHGYNLPAMQWCQKTDLCKIASNEGYVLIVPDFLKTTYQEKFYIQTNPDFLKYPTRKWIRDSVIAKLQYKFNLLIKGENNYVLGLSTGARGAALLSIDLPEIFKAAACLSGDFDQYKLPYEKIYQNYYGKFSVFKEIWKTDDNLHYLIQKWKIPVYLAHGKLDKICPVSQTINFYNLLIKTHPKLTVKLKIDNKAAHDYVFWGSQSKPVIDFFNQFNK